MFTKDLSFTISQNGKLVEEKNGKFLIEYHTPFSIRIKNKTRVSYGIDIYINGDLLNTNGARSLQSNSFIDIEQWEDNRELVLFPPSQTEIEGGDKNNQENGNIEIKLYKVKEIPDFYKLDYNRNNIIYCDSVTYSNHSINLNSISCSCSCEAPKDFIGKGDRLPDTYKSVIWNLENEGESITLSYIGFTNPNRKCFCGYNMSKLNRANFCPNCGRKIK